MYTARTKTEKKHYNIPVYDNFSMCVQWRRAIMRWQPRRVQVDSPMRHLECQSLESSSLLSSSSLSSQSSPVLPHPADTHTTGIATETDPTSAITATVPGWKIILTTTAITTTDVWRDVSCSNPTVEPKANPRHLGMPITNC